MANRIPPNRPGEVAPAVVPARAEPFHTIRVADGEAMALNDLVRVMRASGLLDAGGSRRPVAVSFAEETPPALPPTRVADNRKPGA